jgi:hypothetical protein
MNAFTAVTNSLWPGVPVVHITVPYATDGAYLRAAGIFTYGVQGFFMDREDVRFHGRDEDLLVSSFDEGQLLRYDIIKKLATGNYSRRDLLTAIQHVFDRSPSGRICLTRTLQLIRVHTPFVYRLIGIRHAAVRTTVCETRLVRF